MSIFLNCELFLFFMVKVRVQKIICNNSSVSRRKAEDLIREGRVFVNGEVAVLGSVADPLVDEVRVDKDVVRVVKKVYLLMNKPAGLVTSVFDPNERTIMSVLPDKFKDLNVYPVGRLDKDTTGLLILTNDGDFANYVMHPSNNIKKTYDGVCLGNLSKNDIVALRTGIKLDEGIAKCDIKIIPSVEQTVFEIVLETGWNRQIRRMFDALNHEVVSLRRIKIGGLSLDILGNNVVKEFSKEELEKRLNNKK